KKGRVGVLGGSITEAAGWRNHASKSLKKRFPDTEFEFVYAGIGSTDSTYGAYRLHRDILSKGKIDLLFIESAVNELHNERTRDDISKAVEGIILQARRHNPDIDIIAQYLYDMPYVESYRKGITPWQIAALDRISLQYGINAIDQARQVTNWFESGEISQKEFGGCHPKPAGHKAYGDMIDRLFDRAWAGPVARQLVPHKTGRLYDAHSYDQAGLHPLSLAKIKSGWKLVKNWQGSGTGSVRKHDKGLDYLEATEPGAELTVEFSGTAIGLPMVAGPDVGIIEWQVDGGEWKSLDQFTKWSKSLHIPWIYMLEKELPPGEHTLTLRTTYQKNEMSIGYACRFSAFAVNGNKE
ncbi:MAG: GDSL-type esterase/lipase family protein, partial [Opitutales bacterium]